MKWGRRGKFHNWISTGTPWVWLSAGAVSISLVMVFGLLSLIATRGLIYFWPHDLAEIQHRENGAEVRLIGELHDREEVAAQRLRAAGIELPAHVHTVTRYLMRSVTATWAAWISARSSSRISSRSTTRKTWSRSSGANGAISTVICAR